MVKLALYDNIQEKTIGPYLFIISNLVVTIQAAVNPLIYGSTRSDFKHAFRGLIKRCAGRFFMNTEETMIDVTDIRSVTVVPTVTSPIDRKNKRNNINSSLVVPHVQSTNNNSLMSSTRKRLETLAFLDVERFRKKEKRTDLKNKSRMACFPSKSFKHLDIIPPMYREEDAYIKETGSLMTTPSIVVSQNDIPINTNISAKWFIYDTQSAEINKSINGNHKSISVGINECNYVIPVLIINQADSQSQLDYHSDYQSEINYDTTTQSELDYNITTQSEIDYNITNNLQDKYDTNNKKGVVGFEHTFLDAGHHPSELEEEDFKIMELVTLLDNSKETHL